MGHQGTTSWKVVAVGVAPLDIFLSGAEFDDNLTIIDVTAAPGATLHAQGNVIAPYESAPPYTGQTFYADSIHETSPAVQQKALDALRMLGVLDLKINLPWTSF